MARGSRSQRTDGAGVLAGLRSGDGPLSVRVRPSSLKRDCDRRTTSTGGKCLVNVHAKSRLILEPLRTLRSEDKGQAGACPDRMRAIPFKARAVTEGRGSIPRTCSCCQYCCQATGQWLTDADRCGISAQPTTGDGRSWTMCPLLRIRCSRKYARARCVPDRTSPPRLVTITHGRTVQVLTGRSISRWRADSAIEFPS
jgi:hypothetical protein